MSSGPRRAPRTVRLIVSWIATCALALSAHASGAVATDSSTIFVPGAAAHLGLVVVDPCAQAGDAPVLAAVAAPSALDDPPTAPASFYAGPGGSTFTLGGTSTMAGGTYDCTVLNVLSSANITFTGATTIRASSGASILGRIKTTADDAPLTILSGGALTIGGLNVNNTAVTTAGARSDLTLQAVGEFAMYAIPYNPRVIASQSSVVVRAASAWINSLGLSAGLDVDVRAAGDLRFSGDNQSPDNYPEGGNAVNAGRDAALRSTTGAIDFYGTEVHVAGRLTIDAGAGVLFDSQWTRATANGGIDVFAHGGGIDVNGGALITVGTAGAAGGSTWRARDSITVVGHSINGIPAIGALVTSGASTFDIESVEGDVDVGDVGATSPAAAIEASGVVAIRAKGQVRVLDASHVTATGGVTISAGDASSTAPGSLVESSAGSVIVESTTSVTASGGSKIDGTYVELRSQGTVSVLAEATLESTAGDLVLTGRSVTVAGAATSRGDLRISAFEGAVDIRGATLLTRDSTTSFPSGSITVVAFQGPDAIVLAQGASVRTGAAETSGSIVLRVVAPTTSGGTPPGDPGPGPTTTREDPPYVIPSSVVVKARHGSTSQDLVLRGFVDFGGATVASGATTASIAGVELASNVVVARNGTAVARGADVFVSLGRPRSGSPRRPVTVRARGAFLPADLSDETSIQLAFPDVAAACRVTLDSGRFDARHGRLVEPALYVADVRSSRDGLVEVTLGVPTEFIGTVDSPDVVLDLGAADWHVENGALAADRRGRFAATSPANGLARLSVDPRTRTIVADAAIETLGLTKDGGPLEILARVGGHATRLLRVVVGSAHGRIVY